MVPRTPPYRGTTCQALRSAVAFGPAHNGSAHNGSARDVPWRDVPWPLLRTFPLSEPLIRENLLYLCFFITLYYKQTIMAGAVRRLIFTNNTGYNNNRYVPGSGVGGQNIAVRRHLKRFATSSHGKPSNAPCCPELLQNYGFIRNSPPG